jgi:hypothetical protein
VKRGEYHFPREEARASLSLHRAARMIRGSSTSGSRVDKTKIISYACAPTSPSLSAVPLSPANIARNGVKPIPPAAHNSFLEEGHGVFDARTLGDARNVKSPVIPMSGTLSWRGRESLRSSGRSFPSFVRSRKERWSRSLLACAAWVEKTTRVCLPSTMKRTNNSSMAVCAGTMWRGLRDSKENVARSCKGDILVSSARDGWRIGAALNWCPWFLTDG